MITTQIIKRLRRRPFEPFVIVTHSGERLAVRRPELAKVTPQGVVFVFHPLGDDDASVEGPDVVDVLNVSSLEPIQGGQESRS